MPYMPRKPAKKPKKGMKKKRSGIIVPKKTKPPMKRKSPRGRIK